MRVQVRIEFPTQVGSGCNADGSSGRPVPVLARLPLPRFSELFQLKHCLPHPLFVPLDNADILTQSHYPYALGGTVREVRKDAAISDGLTYFPVLRATSQRLSLTCFRMKPYTQGEKSRTVDCSLQTELVGNIPEPFASDSLTRRLVNAYARMLVDVLLKRSVNPSAVWD